MIPAWAAWSLILSMPLNVVGFSAGIEPVTVLSHLLSAVAFGYAGLALVRQGTGWERVTMPA